MIGIWLQSTTPYGQVNNTQANTYTAGGEITFGGVDTTKFRGHISYVNCAGIRPWSVSFFFFHIVAALNPQLEGLFNLSAFDMESALI
jgi:hypothetical protein